MLQLVQQPVEVPAGLQQELALVLPCHRKALGQRAEERWRSYGCFDEALPQVRRQMTLNLLEFLSRYSERPRGVILRYRRSVRPGGHVGPAGHNRP